MNRAAERRPFFFKHLSSFLLNQRKKNYFGFYTGDIVKANKPKGKGAGEHLGRVTVNSVPTNFKVNAVQCHAKHMRLIQRNDGWKYEKRRKE